MIFLWIPLGILALIVLAIVSYVLYVIVFYVPVVVRIFQEKPLFSPPMLEAEEGAESVEFTSEDGTTLCGSWLRSSTGQRLGTIVFCHEFTSNRWSALRYCSSLRDAGWDIFAFDFRNHGDSETVEAYHHSQWVSNFDVMDVLAAVDFVRTATSDGSPISLMGISRGGGAAMAAASRDHSVAAVATDGAFPTHFTQVVFMKRWVGIYIRIEWLTRNSPDCFFRLIARIARKQTERTFGCTFPKLEKVVPGIYPRPLLMIHGERDGYIVPEIARKLFSCARQPKELWLAPKAKHNMAVVAAEEQYNLRLTEFFAQKPNRTESADSGSGLTGISSQQVESAS